MHDGHVDGRNVPKMNRLIDASTQGRFGLLREERTAVHGLGFSAMIKIEEVTDDSDFTSQAKPATGQGDTVEQIGGPPASPAAPSATNEVSAHEAADEAQQGNSQEDLEVCTLLCIPLDQSSYTERQTLQAVIAEAEQRKQDGNALFKQGKYAEAAVSRHSLV